MIKAAFKVQTAFLIKAVIGFGALLALTSCAISTTGEQALVLGCIPERAELVEGVNWDAVKPIQVTALESDFSPMVFHFTRGKAYALEIRNLDNAANNIWAPGFLKRGVALASIRIGEGQPATGCINGIRIKPLEKVTLRFVAAREGRYEVHNTAFPIIPGQISDGVYYVDPPRPGVIEN